MGKKITLILFGLFLYVGLTFAQNKITGTVFEDNGEPCIGATVMIQGTKQGTKTDLDGNFTLTVPAGKKLVISYVGMITETVKPQDGMKVVIFGSVSVFERDGIYQIYAKAIKQDGVGNLYEKYEFSTK